MLNSLSDSQRLNPLVSPADVTVNYAVDEEGESSVSACSIVLDGRKQSVVLPEGASYCEIDLRGGARVPAFELTHCGSKVYSPVFAHARVSEDGIFRHNCSLLEQLGPYGKNLKNAYKNAVQAEPCLRRVQFLLAADNQDFESTRHSSHVDSCFDASVTLYCEQTDEGIQQSFDKNFAFVNSVTRRLGIRTEQFTPQMASEFTLLHELGHALEDHRAAQGNHNPNSNYGPLLEKVDELLHKCNFSDFERHKRLQQITHALPKSPEIPSVAQYQSLEHIMETLVEGGFATDQFKHHQVKNTLYRLLPLETFADTFAANIIKSHHGGINRDSSLDLAGSRFGKGPDSVSSFASEAFEQIYDRLKGEGTKERGAKVIDFLAHQAREHIQSFPEYPREFLSLTTELNHKVCQRNPERTSGRGESALVESLTDHLFELFKENEISPLTAKAFVQSLEQLDAIESRWFTDDGPPHKQLNKLRSDLGRSGDLTFSHMISSLGQLAFEIAYVEQRHYGMDHGQIKPQALKPAARNYFSELLKIVKFNK